MVKKCICELCGLEISASNYSKHLRRHENHPESFIDSRYKLNHEGLNCQFCGTSWKNRNSLCNHERQCKNNPDRQSGIGFEVFNAQRRAGLVKTWNAGQTKETNSIIAEATKKATIKKRQLSRSLETRNKISAGIKLAYAEGRLGTRLHRLKHDRNYFGTYKGFECDSSYELAFVIYNLDHGIAFERNYNSFEYFFEGQLHKYFPDFKTKDGYIEIKGRITDKDLAKWRDFPKDLSLSILDSAKIQPFVAYCKQTYGENFIELYDVDKPSWKNKTKSRRDAIG